MSDTASKTLFDPSNSEIHWVNVDDPVMGGLSRSHTQLVNAADGAVLVFEGEVSLQNNGGFCSTRTEGHHWELSDGVTRFDVAIRGDGKRYKFTVRTSDHQFGSYRQEFDTQPDELTTLSFAAEDFEMYRRGTHIADAPALDPTTIRSIGFLISDSQKGSFQLEIHQIEAT